jgi:hypothetical protein
MIETSEEELFHSIIKEGSKFNGTSFVENSFTLKVTSRKGNNVQGTIFWDEAKNESKFKVCYFCLVVTRIKLI